jgi:hypothetical protein
MSEMKIVINSITRASVSVPFLKLNSVNVHQSLYVYKTVILYQGSDTELNSNIFS